MNAVVIGWDELTALLPLVALAATAIAVLLLIAFRRDHAATVGLTLVGLVLTLSAVPLAASKTPRAVTELMRIDGYGLFFIGLFCFSGLVLALISRHYLHQRTEQPEEFYLLLLTTLLGASVLAVSTHFASFFLGLETLSISLFPLIAYLTRDSRGLEAATKYLVLSGVASGFLAFGMALLYAETGSLALSRGVLPMGSFAQVGLILMLVGVGFKLSLFPFHLWTADVYEGAPLPVTGLLATVSKGAVFALLMRWGRESAMAQEPLFEVLLAVLAGGSMLVGNLVALRQQNLKRLLAYSSIAHMGYLLLAVIAAHGPGLSLSSETLGFYLSAYTVATLGAFGVMAVVSPPHCEIEAVSEYEGLFWKRPALAWLLTLSLLSLAGIPLTAGFMGKLYLFTTASAMKLWPLLALFVVGSGIGLAYYLRVILQMAGASGQINEEAQRAGLLPIAHGTKLALLFLGFMIVLLGVLPSDLVDVLVAAVS